ncbi:uncharacterized protein LOC144708213 isoform X2 [Wolffia australiana]
MASFSVESTDDHIQSSSIHRKMKFLCSFGGRILPRPSDGALRYVGGHTRIISIKRDASLHELQAKMSEVNGGSTIIRYQLPDEDLDALVTVSSPEDLENMLEEYDKLTEASPDGSAKLRVFLFCPSEVYGGSSASFSSAQTSDDNHGEVESNPFGLVYDPAEASEDRSSGFITVPVSYLESTPIEYNPVEFLEQRDRIKYLNDLVSGAQTAPIDLVSSIPLNPLVGPEDLMPINGSLVLPDDQRTGSEDFLDVLVPNKVVFPGQTEVNSEIQDPLSYFDEIIRQEQPPVGPPLFLLKQESSLSQEQSGFGVKPQSSVATSVDQIIEKLWSNMSDASSVSDPWKPTVTSTPSSQVQAQLGELEIKEAKIDKDDILGSSAFDCIHGIESGSSLAMAENRGSSVDYRISNDHFPATMPPLGHIQKPGPPSYIDEKTLSAPEEIIVPRVPSSRVPDQKREEEKILHSDKLKLESGVVDEQGHRLQVIKNSDLEELRELGTGAFGTVYHGKWRGTDVAIKRINDRCFTGKPSEQERLRDDFWNEACKLADLHHPNVVAFYGVVLDGPGGSMATVTEFMVNGSLWQALRQNDKSLDYRKRLLIAMDAAFGMEYLHGKNMVHFDLKTDNLLVNLRDPDRPICKVGDLGLSKVKRQTLISGGVRGTLPWMAPELLNGRSTLVSEKAASSVTPSGHPSLSRVIRNGGL